MLIHPWDAPISDTEWRNWLAGHEARRLHEIGEWKPRR